MSFGCFVVVGVVIVVVVVVLLLVLVLVVAATRTFSVHTLVLLNAPTSQLMQRTKLAAAPLYTPHSNPKPISQFYFGGNL